MIETAFDIPFIAELALREKQIQQNYRPLIAVHKWFARRPGTLFRGLLLAEFGKGTVADQFYKPQCFTGRRIADPFMGGGTPLVEANRMGCDVVGYDINPMSYWIVRQEIEHLDLAKYRRAVMGLRGKLAARIGDIYSTRCDRCSEDVPVKYWLWVKTLPCQKCSKAIDLLPGALIADDTRHSTNVLVCRACGRLNERASLQCLGKCDSCHAALSLAPAATRNKVTCGFCGEPNRYPRAGGGPLAHRMLAIEYHCPRCKPSQKGRFFKAPDKDDLRKYETARTAAPKGGWKYVPRDAIPRGDETDRLHRWGYQQYREMFNARQLLGLEASCAAIAEEGDERVRHALCTNLSDLLRYQNMLCRYDTMALKSLDIFSVHGFPVGLVQCESNLLGVVDAGKNIGSGGWSNISDKFAKAKAYCEEPFEVRIESGRKKVIPILGEWIGEGNNGGTSPGRKVTIRCGDSSKAAIRPASLDAVFTDPPYYGAVQYAELMDFCYVWLKQLVPPTDRAFHAISTRNESELTQNENMERGMVSFAEGLAAVYAKMAASLKPGAPLAFTYHHNKLEAYYPVATAILDAGFTVTAALPCPAEMEASIHISGTGSSIMDTVFVCRARRPAAAPPLGYSSEAVGGAVRWDIDQLAKASIHATAGDQRCLVHGQMTRAVVERLRPRWNAEALTAQKLNDVAVAFTELGYLACLAASGSVIVHGQDPKKRTTPAA